MNRYLIIAVTYFVMFIFGFVENLKGMAIPQIRGEYGVDFSTIGTMVFYSSFGYLITCFLGGIFSEKFGHKKTISIGYIFIIGATFLIGQSNSMTSVNVFMFLMFCGLGFFETSGNVLAGEVFTVNTAVMLNLMHLFYGLGSVIGPKFAGFYLSSGHSWKQYYMMASLLVFIFFIFTLFVKFPKAEHHEEHKKIEFKKVLSDKKIWFLAIALGMAVTLELGTSNWFVNYLSTEYKMDVNKTSFYMSLFYVTFVIGRLFGGIIAEKIGYLKIIIIFTIAIIVMYSSALILREKGAILISIGGFFVSIIFPTAIAVILKHYKKGIGTIMSFVITISAVINMIFNWVIGKTNDIFGVYIGFTSFVIYAIIAVIFFGITAYLFKEGELSIKPESNPSV